ncbi:MAG: GDSL-type esterase/lipase family protein [Clostridia bacterium]|nr:GDSL-type esterase/lipase family protein [Clostridia bacterium]
MFFRYDDTSIRYTGRYGEYKNTMTATAAGSIFEIAYEGDYIVLHFDISENQRPFPHLYICLDGKIKTEVPLDRYIRLESEKGYHVLSVIYKGGREMLSRFYLPLHGKISFAGFDAQCSAALPEDNRKTIEFVGDSITEGVLIDAFLNPDKEDDQNNRPYQDAVTATYAWLTANALNLKPLFMGYGAVGVTHGGCGDHPKAADGYPYCFEGTRVSYAHPDYILINHGANDCGNGEEMYLGEYEKLLHLIRKEHPDTVIICLSAFLGFCPDGLEKLISRFNKENNDNIHFISGANIIPVQPVHPLRDGHKIIAEYLTGKLKDIVR